MKYTLLIIVFVAINLFSQNSEKKSILASSYPELMASFPGGIDSLRSFIKNNLVLPSKACDCTDAKVFVSFNIEVNGELTEIEIASGYGYEFDEEAKRVVKKMPPWIPAKDKGMTVKTRVAIPISFANL